MSLPASAPDLLPPITVSARRAPDRRAVNRRWLAAVVLVAGGGSALLGVAAVRLCPPRVASAPIARWRGRTAQGVEPRQDRLAAPPAEAAPGGRVRIEQLAGSSGDMKPHTYVSFDLGTQRDASPGVPVARTDAPAPSQGRPGLPPQILFGAAAPPARTPGFAYAEGPALGIRPPLGEPVNVSTAERAPPPAPAAAEAAVALSGRRWLSLAGLSGDERITLDIGRDDLGEAPWRIALAGPGSPTRFAALADDGHYRPLAPVDEAADAGSAAAEPPAGETTDGRQPLRAALATAVRSRDLDPGLVDQAERLCAHDLDLDTPVSARDRAEMVFDDEDGRPRLAFLDVEIGGRPHRYYRYDAADDGSTDYYDPQGRSVTSFLLRKPVAAGRLGDGFGWRIHPVLGDRRFHQGVDYAAPFGSPIVAAGAGTVEKIDQEWGYGKYVRIRHDLGYETTYAHIAAVPRGLAVGQRVHQGQTIAFVGSTGISTGPHLYYEVRINGHNVDPLTVRLAGGRVLGGPALLAFAVARDRTDGLLRTAETAAAPR